MADDENAESTSVLCRALLAWTMAQRTAAVVRCNLSATLRKQLRLTPSAWTRSSQRSAAVLCCMIMTKHTCTTGLHPVTEAATYTVTCPAYPDRCTAKAYNKSPRRI